jgi:hypothetical protein
MFIDCIACRAALDPGTVSPGTSPGESATPSAAISAQQQPTHQVPCSWGSDR